MQSLCFVNQKKSTLMLLRVDFTYWVFYFQDLNLKEILQEVKQCELKHMNC